ncbi:hypothetical protein BAE44_0022987 [Dichanthelium oligosanthes]|uniref:DUF4220 domain-containing protein n=1 Tax=Dichanthelium oligosanthes TaxID=888268 RepID=A0A1E5UT42_9POAL|nr:hypothetical protein BAE44_0022987 [Dichanthelium oligosanthes]
MALSFTIRASSAADILPLLNKSVCATPAATLVANFTVSGDLRNTERLMVTTTVLMTLLGAALFALCLVGRLSGRHRGHSMATRIFFRASFALFLPFMSYMFSQARSKGAPARANLILLWMILVELLRKKVYAMVAPAGDAFALGVGRYSFFDAVEEAARMVWIGYLIYSYVHGAALKSAFVILWIFSVVKLCKRAICIELAKRSFDLAKNASLVSGYMAQLVHADRQHLAADGASASVLSTCNYVVMWESELKMKETPYGFRFTELDDILAVTGQSDHHCELITGTGPVAETTKLVRVCNVWQLAESDDPVFRYDEYRKRKLQDTCLGLALFKLLRRRIEGHRMVEAGTEQARTLVRDGLLEELGVERVFDVVEQELTFLDEYYQAIIPLALPRPQLFVANFVFSILFVVLYGVAVMLVTGNGDMFRVLGSFFHGVFSLSTDMVLQYRCFAHQTSVLIGMVLSSSDLIVTVLLTLTLLTVETYEFVQYLLSDWHLASMLCSYGRKLALRRQSNVRRAVMAALWIKKRSKAVIKVHQFTVLKFHQLHPRQIWMLLSRLLKRRLVGLPDVVVDVEAKKAIVKVLKSVLAGDDHAGGDKFSNGRKALRRHAFGHLEWACDESGGATTVILVWHLATTLLESRDDGPKHPLPPAGKAAVTLSRYCAYLVAYEPGLLPDDPAWTEKAYSDIKDELAGFYRSCCTSSHRRGRLMAAGFHREDPKRLTAMEKGVMLAKELERETGSSSAPRAHHERVWGMLLELWAELLVFVARSPSGGATAHALALANGGEFITHVWAMLTHAGVNANVPDHHDTDAECTDIPIAAAGTAV